MSKAGSRILEGAREALAVAKGEAPAASITVNGHRYVPADRISALEKENAELRGETERMRSDRLYIIGFNAGWESAHEQQPGDDSPFVEVAGLDPIDYALHYGGRCRDCADAAGVCPSSGMPCDPSEARKAAGHVLKAWEYGIEHGYMDNPFAAAIRRIKPSEAEGREATNDSP